MYVVDVETLMKTAKVFKSGNSHNVVTAPRKHAEVMRHTFRGRLSDCSVSTATSGGQLILTGT